MVLADAGVSLFKSWVMSRNLAANPWARFSRSSVEMERSICSGTNLDPFRVYSFTTRPWDAGCLSKGVVRNAYARVRRCEDGAHAVDLEGSSNKNGRYMHGAWDLPGRDMTWKTSSAICQGIGQIIRLRMIVCDLTDCKSNTASQKVSRSLRYTF